MRMIGFFLPLFPILHVLPHPEFLGNRSILFHLTDAFPFFVLNRSILLPPLFLRSIRHTVRLRIFSLVSEQFFKIHGLPFFMPSFIRLLRMMMPLRSLSSIFFQSFNNNNFAVLLCLNKLLRIIFRSPKNFPSKQQLLLILFFGLTGRR